ncbi:hypothetical protein [Roseococcus sp. YIM B11640]|uniref:hypothetical protein n=1 Tax=Roseococcus sp. YIM B11640 TaxID=3133973 RepID=UPI003C7EB5C5
MLMNQILAQAFPSSRRFGRPAFTPSSRLGWKVLRMISTASVSQLEIARSRPPGDVAAARATSSGTMQAEQVALRRLEAVPAAPTKPLPRGSLLDLRV